MLQKEMQNSKLLEMQKVWKSLRLSQQIQLIMIMAILFIRLTEKLLCCMNKNQTPALLVLIWQLKLVNMHLQIVR